MSALRDFGLLWRAALATRHARANAWLAGLALFCALAVGMLAWIATSDPVEVVINCLRGGYVVMAFGWVTYFVPGAIKLNTPSDAVLVPRMRRRLRQLTGLVWLSATALSALLALGSPLPAHILFLGVGFWLISMGLGASGHGIGKFMLFAFPMVLGLNRHIPREWLALLASWPGLAVATCTMLALGALTLDLIFPRGGDRHFQLRTAQKLATDRLSGEGQFAQVRVPRLGKWIYEAALLRDCARRNSSALLMHLLGAATHWTQRLVPMACLVAFVAGAMAILRNVASADTLEVIAGAAWIVAPSALFVQLFDVERRLMRLNFTRGEQSLVRLAPSMPRAGSVFNRYFARHLLLASLGEWAIGVIAILCVVALSGASASMLWMQACISCLALPLLAFPLRDHAHRSGTGGWWLALWWGVSVAFSFLVAACAAFMLGTGLIPAAAFASVVLAAASIAWRWRRLAGAPHAFPVGRLA